MIKLNDIYKIPGTVVSLRDWVLREEWFPEISSHFFGQDCQEVLAVENRLVLKELISRNYDGERTACMYTIWFDGKPVAIVQNAGRGGRDHKARWVTDLAVYGALLTYLMTHLLQVDTEVSDPEVARYEEEVLHFYGTDFAEELGFQCEPRVKAAMLIGNERGTLPGEPSDIILAMLNIGEPDLPEYIRRHTEVFQKVRLVPTKELQERNPRIIEVNQTNGVDRVYLFKPCARPLAALVLSL